MEGHHFLERVGKCSFKDGILTHKPTFPIFNFHLHGPKPAGAGERDKFTHFAHTMIFAKHDGVLEPDEERGKDMRAAVLILLRYDGFLAFPGGATAEHESVIDGVNRRMKAEIGLDLAKYYCTANDYITTYRKPGTHVLFHFFAKEVSFEDFLLIESTAISSCQYGKKVLGCMRVPLYTLDNSRGWPTFLKNNFAENSRQQMCQALLLMDILKPDDMPLSV